MSGNETIRILFVEDLPFDHELAELELARGGIDFTSLRVETKNAFIESLDIFKPDLIISDYSLPQFNGMEALTITRSQDINLPFIILTGTQNEEIAVECMKAGATDYVMKEHIARLSFAVKEAMSRKEILREKLNTEKALLESESRYRSMFENSFAIMLLVDPADGSIVDVNPAAMRYYGLSRDDFITKHVSDISVVDDELLDLRRNMLNGGDKSHIFSRQLVQNGIVRDVEIFCSPLNFPGKKLVHCIVQDITERNRATEALHASLDEKRELVKEIYHRTKNSMQVILSMFSLQTVFTCDEKLEWILRDMENRIRAMSIAHDKLYQSKNLSRLDLKDYLGELIKNILTGYGITNDRIRIDEKIEKSEVLIDTAVPCGLVVNELISNVAKHAFPDNAQGNVLISLTTNSLGELELTVSDDGAGRGMQFDFNNITTMGLMIIKNVVEYQLKGSMEIDTSAGIKWTIKFKDNVYEERV